jgi:hypothetical protein
MKTFFLTISFVFILLSHPANAEDPKKELTLPDAVEIALKNNIEYNNYVLAVEQSKGSQKKPHIHLTRLNSLLDRTKTMLQITDIL